MKKLLFLLLSFSIFQLQGMQQRQVAVDNEVVEARLNVILDTAKVFGLNTADYNVGAIRQFIYNNVAVNQMVAPGRLVIAMRTGLFLKPVCVGVKRKREEEEDDDDMPEVKRRRFNHEESVSGSESESESESEPESEPEDDAECFLCREIQRDMREDYDEQEKWVVFPCKHIICKYCYLHSTIEVCPMCKFDLEAAIEEDGYENVIVDFETYSEAQAHVSKMLEQQKDKKKEPSIIIE